MGYMVTENVGKDVEVAIPYFKALLGLACIL